MLRKMFVSSAGVLAAAFVVACSEGTDPKFKEVAQVTVFSAAGYSVVVGQTLQLEGRAVTWEGVRVDERVSSWASSSPSIATVSNTGLVTGVAVGSTIITATAQGVVSQGRLVNVTATPGGVQ
ncbi:MAG: Ig-like domain-containing protein [Gemmatimonadaceae bacterium]